MKMKDFKLGYFSHSILKNDSDAEKKEYEFIRNSFNGFTICPNKHMGKIGDMSNYLDIVSKADVVFTSELNGFVGIGVYTECKHALEIGTPVFVVQEHDEGFRLFKLKSLEKTNSYNYHSHAKLNTKKYSPKQFEAFKRQ